MALNKNDAHARRYWGDAYDALPKSVFATVAWHLANLASETTDEPGAAETRFMDEIRALAMNGIIPPPQAGRAAKALGADAH